MTSFDQTRVLSGDSVELTAKQKRILVFIRHYIEDHGYPPTVRDIGRAFGIKSPNGVMGHLRAMKRKGAIDRDEKTADSGRYRARTITIPGLQVGGFSIPLLGSEAAGLRRPAVAEPGYLAIHDLFRGDDIFALRVRGSSMIDSQIADGDFVVVRSGEEAANGETVIASVDGETTLKRFKRTGDTIELRPANDTFPSIEVDLSKSTVQIHGVFLGVIRRAA